MIRKFIYIFFGLLLIVALLCIFFYINHQIQLKKEQAIYSPIGMLVEVNNHHMTVYSEGKQGKTLVFMAGGGTCSPILDFKSLYSLLSDDYKIVVVEKAGYGFSEDSAIKRDIHTILSETRMALSLCNISGPYILCPHSMSAIEALYWTNEYPQEISAIIGLDMATPKAYEKMNIPMFSYHLISIASSIGLTRIFYSVDDIAAIKYGTLSKDDQELYKAIFYRRTATTAMKNEVVEIKRNAKKVENIQPLNVPVLMFSSNGRGTGYDKSTWKNFHQEYIKTLRNGKIIELDCPHYVHNYKYNTIAKEIRLFIDGLEN